MFIDLYLKTNEAYFKHTETLRIQKIYFLQSHNLVRGRNSSLSPVLLRWYYSSLKRPNLQNKGNLLNPFARNRNYFEIKMKCFKPEVLFYQKILKQELLVSNWNECSKVTILNDFELVIPTLSAKIVITNLREIPTV